MRVRVSFMPEFVGELTLSYNYIKLIANRLNCLGHNSLSLIVLQLFTIINPVQLI